MINRKIIIIVCCLSVLVFFFAARAIAFRPAPDIVIGQISCGDLNRDARVDINDYNILSGYLYLEAGLSSPLCVADVNGDTDAANILDLEYLNAYLFERGPAPTAGCCDSLYTWNSLGPFDGDGPSVIKYDPLNKNIIYIGNNGHDGLPEGLYKSIDYGKNWVMVFEQPISSFAIDSENSNNLYLGAESGGLYKSIDAGASWSKLRSDKPYFEIAKFTSIAINPHEPSLLYAAANYFFKGYFLYVSFDAGVSWQLVLDNYVNPGILKLLIDPLDSQVLYSIVPQRGVYVSLDAGVSWSWHNEGITNFNLQDIVGGLVNDNGYVYFSLYVPSMGGGVFSSDNMAQTWSNRSEGLSSLNISSLGCSKIDPLKVYVGTDKGLFYSSNAGLNWSIAADLPDYHFYNGDPDVVTPWIVGLAVNPYYENELYASTFSIVFKSKDNGSSWDSTGLPITRITSIAVNHSQPRVIYSGARFGASIFYKSTNQGKDWQGMRPNLYLSDVTVIEIDPVDSSIIYIGSYNMGGGFYKSLDAGQTWMELNDGLESKAIDAIALDSRNSNVLYLGTLRGVFKSNNAGLKWQKTGLTIRVLSLATDPTISGIIYAGTYGDGLYKSIDGGVSWIELVTGLERAKFMDIAVDPIAPNTIYTATINNGVIKSVDGGESWVKINSGLPAIPIYALLIYNPSRSETEIFAGTYGDGVYQSKDGGNSWQQVDINGMDVKKVSTFSYTINDSRDFVLLAGTYGGGIYQKIIPRPRILQPIP